MPETNNNGRQFRPIFSAVITPASIENKTSAKGTGYLLMQGATVTREGQDPKVRTVMAFGKSVDAVEGMLVEGQPVKLAVQYDGGTVRIVGQVREPAAAEG